MLLISVSSQSWRPPGWSESLLWCKAAQGILWSCLLRQATVLGELQQDIPHEPLEYLQVVHMTSLDWKNKDVHTLHYHRVPMKHMKMRSSLTDLWQTGWETEIRTSPRHLLCSLASMEACGTSSCCALLRLQAFLAGHLWTFSTRYAPASLIQHAVAGAHFCRQSWICRSLCVSPVGGSCFGVWILRLLVALSSGVWAVGGGEADHCYWDGSWWPGGR